MNTNEKTNFKSEGNEGEGGGGLKRGDIVKVKWRMMTRGPRGFIMREEDYVVLDPVPELWDADGELHIAVVPLEFRAACLDWEHEDCIRMLENIHFPEMKNIISVLSPSKHE